MSIKAKYFVANNSIHAKEPKQATIPQIMICLQQKQRHCFHVELCVSRKLKMEIPSGYFGKIYPRSSLLKEYFISCDARAIDSDFRVLVLMMNNSNKPLQIKPGQRIGQIVFHKKEVVFKNVDCLS